MAFSNMSYKLTPSLYANPFRRASARCDHVRSLLPTTPNSRESRRRIVKFQANKDTEKRSKLRDPVKRTPASTEQEELWLLDPKPWLEKWDVPWGAKETALGMAGWIIAFITVGFALIPLVEYLAGPEGIKGLSQGDKANVLLLNQCAETAVGLAAIRLAVSRFQPLSGDFFNYNPLNALKKPNGWLIWGLIGSILSPSVVYAAALLAAGSGLESPEARGTVDAVSQMLSIDTPSFLALFTTTAILAPLLEETVFRGFLLTSLTRFLPVPAAVVVSALAFGFVHLTPRDFPQLTALGILLGFSYVRSKNLLTPIMIHAVWNGGVLTLLYFLTVSGVDIQKMLHENM